MYFFIVVLFCISCTHDMRSVKPSVETEYSYYSNGKKEFSAEYVNGKLNGLIRHWSEDGNIISGESDCGRTGTVFFKFLVSDKDGLSEYIIDIPLEIID